MAEQLHLDESTAIDTGRPEGQPGVDQSDHLARDLVTVVVPALNEEEAIASCLDSICAQTHRNLQIIVVDGGSSDRTVEIVEAARRNDQRIELVHNPDRIIPVSLNLAVEQARGAWLVRVDAHSMVPVDYVALAVENLTTGRYGAVGGRKDGVGGGRWGLAIAAAMASRFGVGNSYYHYGREPREVDHVPFGAYPVALIRELNGWDANLRVNQDFEFDHRIRQCGRQIWFDPRMRIQWQSRETISALFRQYRRYGRGKVSVMRKHPKSTRLRHLAAPALVAMLAGGVVAVPRTPAPLAGVAGLYGAFLVAGASMDRHHNGEVARADMMMLAFAAMHMGWGLGFWEGVGSHLAGRR